MSETSESYDVEILDSAGAVMRTLNGVAAASFVYSAAQIAADFPSGLPAPFRFTVYQLSSVVGRGAGKTANFYFS
jgi:hypothetical protein